MDNPDGKLRPGMTANVRIVSQRRENVLRVPNAALRFKPPAELVANANEAAPGGAKAGDGGAPRGDWAARGGQAGGGQGRRRGGGDGSGMGMGRGGAGAGGGGGFGRRPGEGGSGRVFARVYQQSGEKVTSVAFRPGIADDEFTEVIGGKLTQGDEVIIDASGGAFQSSQGAQQQRQPGGNMMRGRGPRMF